MDRYHNTSSWQLSYSRLWNVPWAILLFMLSCNELRATTWAPVYPFVQRSEGGKVISRSVPYGVRDGPYGIGQTFVHFKGDLLYTIDQYFSSPFFTYGNGRYLVSFDFRLRYREDILLIGNSGEPQRTGTEPDGESVHIYDHGVLIRTISLSELGISLSQVRINEAGNWIEWNYEAHKSGTSSLQAKMAKYPAFIDQDRLCLIAAEGQLIEIHIPTGEIVRRSVASEVLTEPAAWHPSEIKRKYERVKFPDKFFLPKLKDGHSLEEATADLFGMVPKDGHKRDADLRIHLHTLLINRHGRVEQVHASVTRKEEKGADAALQKEFEAWIQEQKFNTRTIPRRFNKFKYSGSLELDPHP